MEYNLETGTSDAIDGFFELMGPYFASREIPKELGNGLYDNPKTTWVLCLKHKKLIGFSAVTIGQKHAVFHSQYVVSEERRTGVAAKMDACRMDIAKKAGCTSVRRTIKQDQSLRIKKMFSDGWYKHRQAGRFLVLKKEILYG